jgi:two-component system sensor histidine kinase KdpD
MRWNNGGMAGDDAPPRGKLLVYLGAAPGVGKTIAMLKEGRRRAEAGADVVVGFVETHGRTRTASAASSFESVPPREVSYRGHRGTELNVSAVIVRRPEVALVDELAHTNLPTEPGGSEGNEKRWQDVAALLDAGIDVVSTLNVQHMESMGGAVERITGTRPSETIPDGIVAQGAVRLIDMDPAALRRRLLALSSPEDADRALANYFRLSNLEALRRLTLAWVDAWAAGALTRP